MDNIPKANDKPYCEVFGSGVTGRFRASMALQDGALCVGFDGQRYGIFQDSDVILVFTPEALELVAEQMLKDAKLWKRGELKVPER